MLNLLAYPNLIYIQSSEPADKTAGRLWSDTDDGKLYTSNGSAYNAVSVGVPVGCVQAWVKSYTNTPALSAEWVECNGQTLEDEESVYNGQVIPNLNGNANYLKGGATSGATGGALTHNHAMNSTLGTTTSNGYLQWDLVDGGGSDKRFFDANGAEVTGALSTTTDLYTANESNEPPFYSVVWIIKIK